MSGPLDIQRPALGLADLLGLRAGGTTPQYLSDAVGGSLDMADLYLAQRRTSTMVTGPIMSATPFYAFNAMPAVNVQPGTCYLIYSAFASYAAPAASTYQGALVLRRAGFTTLQGYTYIADGPLIAASTAATWGRYFEKPLIMLPGDTLGFFGLAFSGAGAFPGLYLDYVQLTT